MSEPQPITSAEVDPIVGWSVGVRILHVAHGIASERYARLARFTGVLVAVLTAVVGTALFISAASSESAILRNSAAALSLLAATLGVAQVVLNYPELAIRHRQAFVEYGKLRRELDIIRLVARARPVTEEELRSFRAAWAAVETTAPVVPGRLRAVARRSIDRADARERPKP